MISRTSVSRLGLLISMLLIGVVLATPALADHAWSAYHWARTSNPFTLKVGDSVTSVWDTYLRGAAADWSTSSLLDLSVVAGLGSRLCRASTGRVEACNAKYGNNGWLGVAQIWVSGSHITQGVVKMNDTYFNTATYNKPEWRAFVMCQELGHTLGLDHQDEAFSNENLDTCMDYTNDPLSNQHPDAHDFDMLETIYSHLDTSTTIKSSAAGLFGADIGDEPSRWGREIARDYGGRSSLFMLELAPGEKVFTHVIWAESAPEYGRFNRNR